jgi:hypothetical protein
MNQALLFILAGLFNSFGNSSFAQEPSKSCSVVFPSQTSEKGQHHSQTSEKISHHLESSPQFQEAAHSYFQATIGQASQAMTTQEKMSLFSKLAQFAQQQKLSKVDFTAMVEAAKDKFIHTQILGIQPGVQVIELNPQRIHNLEQSKYQVKLSTKAHYHSASEFISELEKAQQDPIQTARQKGNLDNTGSLNFLVPPILETIKDLDEYSALIAILTASTNDPWSDMGVRYYIHFNDQNPNLRQVVFEYSVENLAPTLLWVLQEKVDALNQTPKVDSAWKTIAHYKKKQHLFFDYRHLFAFYAPDVKKIVLATFWQGNGDFVWIILDSKVTPELISKLPHIHQNEQDRLQNKMNDFFNQNDSELLNIYFNEQSKSFYLTNYTLPEKYGNHIHFTVTHISPKDEQDFKYSTEFHLESAQNVFYASYFSFAKDGSFFKITHHALQDKSLLKTHFSPLSVLSSMDNYHINQPAPPPGEDGPFRQTKYFFPINSLQVKSSISRSE